MRRLNTPLRTARHTFTPAGWLIVFGVGLTFSLIAGLCWASAHG